MQICKAFYTVLATLLSTMFIWNYVFAKVNVKLENIGFEALHVEVSICLVCGNTICVSTCQVKFVLRKLSCFILLPQSRFIRRSWDFSVLKRTVLLLNYYPGRRYKKFAGTTTGKCFRKFKYNMFSAEFFTSCYCRRDSHFQVELSLQFVHSTVNL